MKQPLTFFEFFLVVGLMVVGSNLLNHPASTNQAMLGWSLLLIPAAWFHLHLFLRWTGRSRGAV